MNSVHCYKLAPGLGVHHEHGDVELCDTSGCIVRTVQVLTDEEMESLLAWYREGDCPVCGTGINSGEVICDSCFTTAQQHRQRNDPDRFKDAALEEYKLIKRKGDLSARV